LPDAGLEELFAAAESLNAPLFLHPFRVLGADRLSSDFMTNTCGNPFEITVAALSLFFDGTFDRHPRLRLLLSHCCGALPLAAGRTARGSQVNPRVRRRAELPSEILDLFYYDTVVHDVHALALRDRAGGAGAMRAGLRCALPDARGPSGSARARRPCGLRGLRMPAHAWNAAPRQSCSVRVWCPFVNFIKIA
jgi:aminocarboxymuconate-semialdehyde decarboxylase